MINIIYDAFLNVLFSIGLLEGRPKFIVFYRGSDELLSLHYATMNIGLDIII